MREAVVVAHDEVLKDVAGIEPRLLRQADAPVDGSRGRGDRRSRIEVPHVGGMRIDGDLDFNRTLQNPRSGGPQGLQVMFGQPVDEKLIGPLKGQKVFFQAQKARLTKPCIESLLTDLLPDGFEDVSPGLRRVLRKQGALGRRRRQRCPGWGHGL